MGFDGVIVSDYSAIRMFNHFHHLTPDPVEAGRLAVEAGIDIEAPSPYGYCEEFREAVHRGDIDEKYIDECVLNVLKMKFRLGLFEDAYVKDFSEARLHTDEAVALSRKLDEESILLLENDGILPLDEKKINKVAVIGNNAKDSFTGDYIFFTDACVDFYDGMVARLGEDRVIYSLGCNPVTTTEENIAAALQAAEQADVIFLVLGDCTEMGGGDQTVAESKYAKPRDKHKKVEVTCGEGYDMHSLDFPPSQKRLFDAVTALGKPTILILYAGRPYTIKDDVSKVNAFMFSFGGGEQSGNAFANLIFGDKSPSAKTAISFPQSEGHIPCHYNYKPSARGRNYKTPGTNETPGRDYVLSSPDAWYPFGYGLSYTEVKYSNLVANKINEKEVRVTVDVHNIGNYDINESVLLFVSALYCPITPFIKKLRKFAKVYLHKGEKKTIAFTLTNEDFTYIDLDMKVTVNHGTHKIMIANLELEIEF